MSDQAPSPHPPPPQRRSQALSIIMIVLGVILLLPGGCALIVIGFFLVTQGANTIRDIVTGEPTMNIALVVWAVCILVSLFGIWLIRRARR